MIIIGLGSNLPGPDGETPVQILEGALEKLAAEGVKITARSTWYETEPVPPSDQPNFINGVVAVECLLSPQGLMDILLRIEESFGRRRVTRWEARVLDLDIIDFEGMVLPSRDGWQAACEQESNSLILPHPRMHQRRFVLEPLAEILPEWTHPALGQDAEHLLEQIA